MKFQLLKQYLRQVFTRLGLLLVTIFAIATATFILMKMVPGDPFQDEQGIPEECLQNIRRYYGLEDPLIVQYGRFLKSIALFDFGPSLKYPAQSVNNIITECFPISFMLGLEALCIVLPCSLLIGLFSALRYGKPAERAVMTSTIVGISIPTFVTATLLQFLFAIYFPIFPVARLQGFIHTILPALALSIAPTCILSRLLRASTLEVLHEPYVYMAYAKGLKTRKILLSHVLRNSLLPVISYLGPITTNILVGSFVVERVFAIPGLGQWFIAGVLNRDFTVIGGLTIFYSSVLLIIHMIIDIINVFLDPRIRANRYAYK